MLSLSLGSLMVFPIFAGRRLVWILGRSINLSSPVQDVAVVKIAPKIAAFCILATSSCLSFFIRRQGSVSCRSKLQAWCCYFQDAKAPISFQDTVCKVWKVYLLNCMSGIALSQRALMCYTACIFSNPWVWVYQLGSRLRFLSDL